MRFKPVEAEKFSNFYKTRKIANILIDTRTPEKFKSGYIEKAVNIPLSDKNFKEKVKTALSSTVVPAEIIIAYADDAESTKQMLDKFKKIYNWHFPFKRPHAIFYLDGGYSDWLKNKDNKEE